MKLDLFPPPRLFAFAGWMIRPLRLLRCGIDSSKVMNLQYCVERNCAICLSAIKKSHSDWWNNASDWFSYEYVFCVKGL